MLLPRCLVAMLILACPVFAADAPAHDVAKLEAAEKKYLATLDVKGFAADYPKVVRDLDSNYTKAKRRALNVIGSAVDIRAIPLVIPLLKDPAEEVRVYAAIALNNVTVGTALERRDQKRLHTIALRPLGKDDPDMRPLAAVVLSMLQRKNEPNIVAHALPMVGYLGLHEFEPEVRMYLKSDHPSVSSMAQNALNLLHVDDTEADPEQAK